MDPTRSEHDAPLRLRLFIGGGTAADLRAQRTLRRLAEEHLGDNYDLEVIDVYDDPDAAERDGIMVTPLLLILGEGFPRRLAGDMSNEQVVLDALGVDA